MRKHSLTALLGLSLVAGCQRPDKGEPGPPEISILVNATRVEVIAQQSGSCRALLDVHDPDVCVGVDWEYKGVGEFFERSDCVPDPTCVDEVRLERAGTAIATRMGAPLQFSTQIAGDETLVILGCGAPLNIELPPPLSDAALQVEAKSDGIHLAATGDGVQSMLGRAVSMSYSQGFSSACRSESGPVILPTSPDFSEYIVESFALGAPIVLQGGSVHVYPALRRKEALSQVLPLGPVWQATVAAAKLSPHYDVCDGYCSAWQQTCYPTANRDVCNVSCVAEPTLRASCADEFEQYMSCSQASPSCEEALAADSDSGAGAQAVDASPPCAAESTAYAECVGAEQSPN